MNGSLKFYNLFLSHIVASMHQQKSTHMRVHKGMSFIKLTAIILSSIKQYFKKWAKFLCPKGSNFHGGSFFGGASLGEACVICIALAIFTSVHKKNMKHEQIDFSTNFNITAHGASRLSFHWHITLFSLNLAPNDAGKCYGWFLLILALPKCFCWWKILKKPINRSFRTPEEVEHLLANSSFKMSLHQSRS